MVHVKSELRQSVVEHVLFANPPPPVAVFAEIPQNLDMSLSSFAPANFPSPTRCSTPMSTISRKRQKSTTDVKYSMTDERSTLYAKERERIQLQIQSEETRHMLLQQQLENEKTQCETTE